MGDLNPRPTDYESVALPSEPMKQNKLKWLVNRLALKQLALLSPSL